MPKINQDERLKNQNRYWPIWAITNLVGFERLQKLNRLLEIGRRIAGFYLILVSFALISRAQTAPPQINTVVNAASNSPAVAPGSLISIYGSNLSAGVAQATDFPLPLTLQDAAVTWNDAALPLLYVSGPQINAQLPLDAQGSGTLRVTNAAGSSAVPLTLANTAPGILSAAGVADVAHADGSFVTPSAPAKPGEALSVYLTGLGAVNGALQAGNPAPGSPPLSTTAQVQVQIGGSLVTPGFAGLAPGFAGLYQVNLQVPQMNSGTYSLTVIAAGTPSNSVPLPVANPAPVSHYEYVFPDGNMYVYDMDNNFQLVKHVTIPVTGAGIRGVVANPQTHTLYISYGGDGDGYGNGSMLAYDLLTDQVLWSVDYPFGIDSMAITPDGKTIYMPTGELNEGNVWNVLDASSGKVIASIAAGAGPHNTVVGLDGSRVYMGPRQDKYLYVASTATNAIIQKIGPMIDTVRPFTVNGKQTLAFTTHTSFLGFQVSDINTGKVLYTVPVAGFSVPSDFPASTPSHGISLSPDEKEIWVMDAANSYVHVFDVTGLPGSPPKQVADLKLSRPVSGNENLCEYDCGRDGWIQHSRNGRFVFIGDSGDVFDAAARKAVTNLDPLYNTRKFLEIDWQNGAPMFSTGRQGLGYVTQ